MWWGIILTKEVFWILWVVYLALCFLAVKSEGIQKSFILAFKTMFFRFFFSSLIMWKDFNSILKTGVISFSELGNVAVKSPSSRLTVHISKSKSWGHPTVKKKPLQIWILVQLLNKFSFTGIDFFTFHT